VGETEVPVLVVEDDAESRRLLCELFTLRGYQAVPAETGTLALELAAQIMPRLIMMDIQLPDMTGTAALAGLRANPTTARIPVVAVTAFAMQGDRERILADGFDGYLSKPISVHTLVDEMAPLLNADRRSGERA
jgi:two-component system cell cycle response regulator DivK